MKKLITGVIATAALLFGFASCSGDLHDNELPKHEPVTISGGSWYYTDITIWGDNEGTSEGLIVNGSGNASIKQSTNATLPVFTASKGGVAYYTVDNTKASSSNKEQYEMLVSYQTDNPAYTLEPGKLRIYVYTNETSPNLYYWGADSAFKAAAWPGTPLSKVGEAAATSYSMTIKNVIVKNLPASLNGKKLGYRGSLVDSDWAFVEANSSTVANGEITVPVNKTCTVNSTTGYAKTSEFKIADDSWTDSIGIGFGGDNDATNVSVLLVDGATVNIIGYYIESNSTRTDKHRCVWYLEAAE